MPVDERRFDPQNLARLTSPERLARWQPSHFLRRFTLPAASRILELGCGPGFWSLSLAEITGPAGHVFALDASLEMLAVLAAACPPAWVFPIQNELPGLALAPASCDFIWAAFVAHEVQGLPVLAGEMCRVLRSGGRVAILEWRSDPTSPDGPPLAHRLSTGQVGHILQTAGFTSVHPSWHDSDTVLIEAVKK